MSHLLPGFLEVMEAKQSNRAGKYRLCHFKVDRNADRMGTLDCWEIDVFSWPCTERDGHPAVTPSSLLLTSVLGCLGEALSECVWVDSVRGMAGRRCNVSILKGPKRHVEECWRTRTTFL